MMRFLYLVFIRPHEPVIRIVRLIPAALLSFANEFLDLFTAMKRARQLDLDEAQAAEATAQQEAPSKLQQPKIAIQNASNRLSRREIGPGEAEA